MVAGCTMVGRHHWPMAMEALRTLLGEVRWLVDPSDPLRRYNRQLAWALRGAERDGTSHVPRLFPIEGHMLKAQAKFLGDLVSSRPSVTKIVEIGFNAGHSSQVFLAARRDVEVLSFDLGEHPYVDIAKALIDRQFPGRHRLVKGDSRETVPAFADATRGETFDLIYIDGCHDFEVARADLDHCRCLSRPDSILVVDDLEPDHEWGAGPARAWRDALASGLIDAEQVLEDGRPVQGVDLEGVRTGAVVWGVGRYRTG
jgi:predicted O-methyltransferase YrrM